MSHHDLILNMDALQDELCFILDLEGFFTHRKFFHVRELGYYTWNQENGRHAFFIPIPHKALNDKDKSTFHFVCNKIHGLSYQPTQAEHAYHPMLLKSLVKKLYQKHKTNTRTVVGYKGGHVEKDLLEKLNIPSLNLETLGCPKYDVLKTQFESLVPSCGFHKDDKVHHCPVTECHAFWKWYQSLFHSV